MVEIVRPPLQFMVVKRKQRLVAERSKLLNAQLASIEERSVANKEFASSEVLESK